MINTIPLLATASIVVLLCGCSYSNSTPEGRTVADDRTILEVRKVIALHQSTSQVQLRALSLEKRNPWFGVEVKSVEGGLFEVSCSVRCKDQLLHEIQVALLPKVEKIIHESKEGRTVVEKWIVRGATGAQEFQVRFFYVPGGGGESPFLARKPDLLYVTPSSSNSGRTPANQSLQPTPASGRG